MAIPEPMPQPVGSPIGWTPNALGQSIAQMAAAAATPGGSTPTGPSFVTIVGNDPAQNMTGVGLAVIARALTAAEVGTASDITLLNGQTGRVILPLYAWVHLVTGGVAPSSGRTVSIAYAAGGNMLTGSITSALANQNNWRSFDLAEAALATNAQALGSALVIRTTSAAITPNGATSTIYVACLLVTP